MSRWVRFHFEHLRRWREYAEKVAKAAEEVAPGSRVYVIGGVAEGRVTVLSDIDVLVVVPGGRVDKRRLAREILEKAIRDHGLPWDAPVEVHVALEDEEGLYEGRRIPVTTGRETRQASSRA